MSHGGVRSQQLATYDLLGAPGSKIRSKVTYEQTTPKQTIRPPGSANNVVLELSEVDFEGQGEGTWKLGQLAPVSATEHTNTILKMLEKIGDKTEAIVIGTDAILKIN